MDKPHVIFYFLFQFLKKSEYGYVYNEVISKEKWMMKIMLKVPKLKRVTF